jgi:UDP-N-acetyl-D-mannosaminuronic acid dehydrogenase
MTGSGTDLARTLADRSARLAVIGMGFVGTPVACRFAEVGFEVTGIDVDAGRVARLRAGCPPFDGPEPGLTDLLQRVVESGRLLVSTDYGLCRDSDVFLIAVDTPVDATTHRPDDGALLSAARGIGPYLVPGCLVIVESTVAPGTLAHRFGPTLAAASGLDVGREVHLVHCPERVMPGRLLANLRSMHRVVGGTTPEAAQLAVALYRTIVEADLDPTDAVTAELVKTAENAYRDVQIAFANELALLCEATGADVWQVRRLVNKSPGRDVHLPGAGVGGHCIPKDPWLLVAPAAATFDARLVPAARAVNDGMPGHVADRLAGALADQGVALGAAKILILGYSYLEESDDTRNSPSEALARRLAEAGAEVVIHDPWVPAHRTDLLGAAAGCDAAVLMVAHQAYRALDLAALAKALRRPVLVDGRGVVDRAAARAAGLRLLTIGVGGAGGVTAPGGAGA